jgi:subtilisin family serine protease
MKITMFYNKSTAIVGFYESYSLANASFNLSSIIGFVRVKRRYDFINAILVEVEASHLEEFINDVTRLDEVEYSEKNYLLELSSYEELVHKDYRSSNFLSTKDVRKHHNLERNWELAGLGTKIAIIDSGMSPHPYLPATSYAEAVHHSREWPNHCQQNDPFYKLLNLSKIEPLTKISVAKNAGNGKTLSQKINEFVGSIGRQELNRFIEEAWKDWGKSADSWVMNKMSSSCSEKPNIPLYKHVCGSIRRISPESKNFLDDSLNIEDTHGHGTKITGLLVGKGPGCFVTEDSTVKNQLLNYEFDILGIVPMAEVMILKVYDKEKLEDSSVDALIRALEYTCAKGADLVYTGLSFSVIEGKKAIALERAIKKLVKDENIGFVCAVGNKKKEGLAFPAYCYESIAVTSVLPNSVNSELSLADYSNWADWSDQHNKEKIDFSAIGGCEDRGLITADLSFGYTTTSGTSVAAAVCTGILALEISGRYLKSTQYLYDSIIDKCVPSNPPSNSLNEIKNNIIPGGDYIDDIVKYAKKISLKKIKNFDSQKHGFGLIQFSRNNEELFKKF